LQWKFEPSMQDLKVIAFTHKKTPLGELSRYFLHEENKIERLSVLKFGLDLDEICYIATCNRMEFILATGQSLNHNFLTRFFKNFRDDWTADEIQYAIAHCETFEGEEALEHMFKVASSLDSMVIGEREIITQVRKAYDECHEASLTGDLIRLVIKSTITTAKQVYTETHIATNPVSVVSLAYRRLRDLRIAPGARILMIGAGETNSSFSKYLVKYGFNNIIVYNRTLAHAEKLVAQLSDHPGQFTAASLEELSAYRGGFDVIVSCTGSAEPVVTPELYRSLLNGDASRKVVIDLAVPADVDAGVIHEHNIHLINIDELKGVAEKNLAERKEELAAAEHIVRINMAGFRDLHRTRRIELAMKDVPEKIREIKQKAVTSVFAKEIEQLDSQSRDVLDKVLTYMEKKCISIPMVMAKEIILESR